MPGPERPTNAIIDWGVASKPMIGEVVKGDNCFVQADSTQGLVVVVDALGHGSEAAQTAELAMATVTRHASEPIVRIFEHCHEALRRTRGAVMSAARFNAAEQTLTWLGIGNVEGVIVHRKSDGGVDTRSFVVRGGVVGYQLPRMQVSTVPIVPGDTLVVATDGLALDFITHLNYLAEPQPAADDMLRRCSKASDDALVLVTRYLGAQT